MFCCACAGTCNHVGPHTYCAAHGGTNYGGVPEAPRQHTNGLNVTFYSCPHGGDHDFAVGPEHAICNRCEKVIALSDPSPSAALAADRAEVAGG